MASELGSSFDLDRALAIGLVPLIWQASDPKANLAAYASLYLQEEVQAEALVSQIGDFSRFLEVISFSQASQLNLASLAREAEFPRKRAESYLSILEDLLLAFRLPVFQKRTQRQLVQHQKFFFRSWRVSHAAIHRPARCPREDRGAGAGNPGGAALARVLPAAAPGRQPQLLAHPFRPGGGFCGVRPRSVLGDRGEAQCSD
jgi:predicted AAA+ superfamily ATPase